MQSRASAIIDSSTLINFLTVDRGDLLERNPRYRFFITEHVRGEITAAYPDEVARLEALVAHGGVEETSVSALNELRVFARLAATNRLGPGECACIAAASERGLVLVIDDRRATREARSLSPNLPILDTQSLMLDLIRDRVIDVVVADQIKHAWETEHHFRLPFASFAERLNAP
jgi:predicted nucleic acid-binding protein